MNHFFIITFFTIILITKTFSQALPIGMDGTFDDWNNATANYTDTQGDGASYDLLSFSVSNDSTNLFIKFTLDQEIQLNYGNNLYLEIDTDNNPETGYQVNGIGVELAIKFGEKKIYYNLASGGTTYPKPAEINLVILPTVTSNTYEISIGRDVLPDGIHQLFTSNKIKLFFADFNSGGDYMPNSETFEYTFDDSDVEAYQPISFEKNNSTDVRLMTYNTLADFDNDIDGIFDPSRQASFERIIKEINPDIITFNECWFSNTVDVINLLDAWIPLPNNEHWKCGRVNSYNINGNITCSKFPISQNYIVPTDYSSRIIASKINLPSTYPKDIIVINSHLKASNGTSENEQRQAEVDSIISFIHKIKTEGDGIIENIPYGTPFVISGDLNLVGNSQQLKTLLTGQDETGQTLPPDWDNSNLNNVISFHTDERMAYTINDATSNFWPGRIDYAICSNVGASVSKAFTIHTASMSADRLAQYGLHADDTDIASDHLPKVTDLIIEDATENISSIEENDFFIFPNPSKGIYSISTSKIINNIDVYNILGKVIFSKYKINKPQYNLDLRTQKSGIYFIKIKSNNSERTFKIIKQ